MTLPPVLQSLRIKEPGRSATVLVRLGHIGGNSHPELSAPGLALVAEG